MVSTSARKAGDPCSIPGRGTTDFVRQFLFVYIYIYIAYSINK